jgi:hypothetical protein
MFGASGRTPSTLTRPKLGLQVATPQYEAGLVKEPPV